MTHRVEQPVHRVPGDAEWRIVKPKSRDRHVEGLARRQDRRSLPNSTELCSRRTSKEAPDRKGPILVDAEPGSVSEMNGGIGSVAGDGAHDGPPELLLGARHGGGWS